MANPTQTTPTLNAISAPMMEVSQNLAENLAQSEPFLRYKTAQDKLNADAQAQRLLAELPNCSKTCAPAVRRHLGKPARTIRELQTTANLNETIQEFGLAQEYAVAFLREVNREISQLIRASILPR